MGSARRGACKCDRRVATITCPQQTGATLISQSFRANRIECCVMTLPVFRAANDSQGGAWRPGQQSASARHSAGRGTHSLQLRAPVLVLRHLNIGSPLQCCQYVTPLITPNFTGQCCPGWPRGRSLVPAAPNSFSAAESHSVVSRYGTTCRLLGGCRVIAPTTNS